MNDTNPYAHLNDRQRALAADFEAAADGADLADLLAAADLDPGDKAALAQAWAGPEAAADKADVGTDDDWGDYTDTYEALAQRCERGAETLEREADNAADLHALRPDLGGVHAWATKSRAAARAAREYAAQLRAEAPSPDARLDPARFAQAERVAQAAQLGGILADGRPQAEYTAQSGSIYDRTAREMWEAGTHPTQVKAREIEASGMFTHVTVDPVPFWQLGRADENTTGRRAERADRDGDEF